EQLTKAKEGAGIELQTKEGTVFIPNAVLALTYEGKPLSERLLAAHNPQGTERSEERREEFSLETLKLFRDTISRFGSLDRAKSKDQKTQVKQTLRERLT